MMWSDESLQINLIKSIVTFENLEFYVLLLYFTTFNYI